MIRAATPADIPVIRDLIRELAVYEKAEQEARATPEQLRAALFGTDPVASAVLAQDEVTGETVGFALWFRNFSTWTGSPGMYLEDLYVRPSARGAGHGTALLSALAAICVARGWSRFEWTVLDWNERAIGVYRSIGARPQDEWTVQRLTGPALHALADRADGPIPGAANNRTIPQMN